MVPLFGMKIGELADPVDAPPKLPARPSPRTVCAQCLASTLSCERLRLDIDRVLASFLSKGTGCVTVISDILLVIFSISSGFSS